jgi:hypothetical protein
MSHLAARRVLVLSALSLLSMAVAASACSAAGSGVTTQGSTSGSTGSAGGGGGAGGSLFDAGNPDALPDPDAACGLITVDAHATPLDLYIAFDKSSSMVGTKWNGAKAGLEAFLADPTSAGIRVAINFFPLDNNPTCDQFAYKPPVVPFGLLPGNAAAVSAAIDATTPNGFSTPIYPALGGGILAGIEEAMNNPGDAAAVLLVTDGQPDGPAGTCGMVNPDDPAAIADLAAKGVAFKPSVKTFVIGLPGINQATANQIAAAGGTGSAILVTITNVQTEFQNALAKVRGQALPCEYDIPAEVAGGQVDPGYVNVEVTPGGGPTSTLPQDAACTDVGWKYDDPAHPKHIELCPKSCTSLKAESSAKVQILLGCTTQVLK